MNVLKNTIDLARKHYLRLIYNTFTIFFAFIAVALWLIRFFDVSFGLGFPEAFRSRPNNYYLAQTLSLAFLQMSYIYKLNNEKKELEKVLNLDN